MAPAETGREAGQVLSLGATEKTGSVGSRWCGNTAW